MEIEKIVSTARQELGQTSLTDRTLTEYFTAVNPQGEINADFWKVHTPILKSMSGQVSHEIAEYMKAHPQISTGEQNNGAAGGQQPVTAAQVQNGGMTDEMKAIFEKQNEQIEKLSQIIAGQQRRQSEADLRNGAAALRQSLGISDVRNVNIWNDAVSRIAITDGMSADAFNAQVKQTYEQNLKAFLGDGVQPYGSTGPTDSAAQTNAALDAFFASKGFGQNK